MQTDFYLSLLVKFKLYNVHIPFVILIIWLLPYNYSHQSTEITFCSLLFYYSALNIFCTNCGALQHKVDERFSNTFLPAFKEVLRIAGEQVNCVNKDVI